MKFNHIIKKASALLTAVLLTACAPPPVITTITPAPSPSAFPDVKKTDAPSGENAPVLLAEISAAPLINPSGDLNETYTNAAGGINNFAFDFSNKLLNSINSNGNFICSPFSAWAPLAALVNATEGEDRQKLLSALKEAGVSPDDLNTVASRLLYDITKVSEKEFNAQQGQETFETIKIADALFVDRGSVANPEFVQTFADYYRGTLFSVDFTSKDAPATINKWASDNTEGEIPEIIKEFTPNTKCAIANAVYFRDRWAREFDPNQTKEDVFYGTNGENTAQFMQMERDDLQYFEDDALQAVNLRFSMGGGMLIMLPKDKNANELLMSLNSGRFSEILNGTELRTGNLLLPRFEIDMPNLSLNTALTAMGVPLFDSAAPAITGLLEGGEPLYLSQAIQSAKIVVDEKGTTAAAVTAYGNAAGAVAEPTDPFTMNCNSPFVFVLYQGSYDAGFTVLFTGVLNEAG